MGLLLLINLLRVGTFYSCFALGTVAALKLYSIAKVAEYTSRRFALSPGHFGASDDDGRRGEEEAGHGRRRGIAPRMAVEFGRGRRPVAHVRSGVHRSAARGTKKRNQVPLLSVFSSLQTFGRQSEFTEHVDEKRPLACAQRSVCSANRRLASNYGQMGKVLAKLGR